MRKTKQTYVKPETEVVEIATAQILCASGGTGPEGTHGGSAPEFELEN